MTQVPTTFDAIVIGSGISGGWAAKELCEKGLKTLVLERGRQVEHIKDYPTANLAPWELPHRGFTPRKLIEANPLISKAAGYGEDTAHFFVKDADHPYVQEKPFDWIRGYQVGGKSLIWGRACQRWSRHEFTAPERHGYGINWPIGYDDVAPWYSHVERFIGVCGAADGLEAMPDGEFLPPFDFNCVEQHLRDRLRAHYGNRHVVQGRWAHLSQPKEIHLQQGRGTCQARNLCMRGCPYGGYFSSNSSTLPWAAKTGNLTMRPDSVVHSILYDEAKGKATGVRVIDAHTHAVSEYRTRIVFVNASALNTNLILLNSTSHRFPHGLGNDNGLLGTHVAHHNYRTSANGTIDGFEDRYFYGRNPTECILVNFRNVGRQETDFVGGYTTFTGAYRVRGAPTGERFGGDYKDAQAQPGPWGIYMYMQGETIPKQANHVRLHETKKDVWGIMSTMNRREALRVTSVLLGGALVTSAGVLAACAPESRKTAVGALTPDDQALIEEIADTLLPSTPASPGAKAAGAGSAINWLLTDCYPPDQQQRVVRGLADFRATCRERSGGGFASLAPPARAQLLGEIDAQAQKVGETHYFGLVRELASRAYFSSEIGMTRALRYVRVPGRWTGCVLLAPGQPAWG